VAVGLQECNGEVVSARAFEIRGAAVLGRERLQLRSLQQHDQGQLVPVAGGSIELARERIQEEIGHSDRLPHLLCVQQDAQLL